MNSSLVLQECTSSSSDISKSYNTTTASPGPSRVNRILTPVNQVTPLYKRYMDSAGNISHLYNRTEVK